MPNLVPHPPLMQPVVYNGQEYFTSQYFHAAYLANSPHGGKYRRLDSFIKILRETTPFRGWRKGGWPF